MLCLCMKRLVTGDSWFFLYNSFILLTALSALLPLLKYKQISLFCHLRKHTLYISACRWKATSIDLINPSSNILLFESCCNLQPHLRAHMANGVRFTQHCRVHHVLHLRAPRKQFPSTCQYLWSSSLSWNFNHTIVKFLKFFFIILWFDLLHNECKFICTMCHDHES